MLNILFYAKITPEGKEYFMCKLLLVPVFVALCFADFSAFSATARNSRGMTNTANNNAVAAPVAARAAVRGTTKTTTNAAPVAARLQPEMRQRRQM